MDQNNLFEAITNNAAPPARFWLVFDIPTHYGDDERSQARLADIARGSLTGVRGISDSKEILTGWWLIGRNAAVMMDASKVISTNDVEKISYDDPDHLCQDNFRLLYRLWDKEKDITRGDKYDGMMANLVPYFLSGLKTIDPYNQHYLDYYGLGNKAEQAWAANRQGVHDSDSAADLMYHFATTLFDKWDNEKMVQSLKKEDFYKAMRLALTHVGRIYSDESEWLVHSPSFTIPQGSTMMIGVSMEAARQYQAWKADPESVPDAYSALKTLTWFGRELEKHDALMKYIEDFRLRDRYKIAFVDARRFEDIRPAVKVRRNKAKGIEY